MNENTTTNEQNAFITWKHTIFGRVVWTALDVAIAYIFASLALDAGALWQWGVAFLFGIDAIYNICRLIGLLTRGRKTRRT